MKKDRLPEVSVEEILGKIEDELGIQSDASHDASRGGVNAVRCAHDRPAQGPDMPPPVRDGRGLIHRLLWKYGTRYAAPIKKVPGLSRIAEHYYWKLARARRPLAGTSAVPPHGSDLLAANLHYAGFIEGLKGEGLKGKIKRAIFSVIGFFGWWQGQINSALHEKLAAQQTRLAAQETQLAAQQTQLVAQQTRLAAQETQLTALQTQLALQGDRLSDLEARLAAREQTVEGLVSDSFASGRVVRDIWQKLSVVSRLQDAIYDELTAQRAEIARKEGWKARPSDAGEDRN